MPSETNLRAGLLQCFAQKKLDELLERMPRRNRRRLLHDFTLWGREAQFEPQCEDWRLWLVLGGRGAGKSRTGAEWIKRRIRYAPTPLRVALLGPSLQEARSVMVEGESGLLAVHAHDEEPPLFLPTKREMIFPNGSIAQLLSADSPESLRGPQFHLAWCDELAKWRYRDEAWNMLQFALRLGERPQQIVTTTPKPSALLKRLIEDKQTVLTRTPTSDNWALSRSFLCELDRIYGGTLLERQELLGELIEEVPGALFSRSNLDEHRIGKAPPLRRIVVAVDPPVSATQRSDACGIVCAGQGVDERAYVLDDATRRGLKPVQWARRVIALYHARKADVVLAEVNQGGNLVGEVLCNVDANVPVRPVTATRGKFLRAEPVATLYEQGRVSHVGAFPELEDEMCAFTPEAHALKSPDRVDALVWALSELMLKRHSVPRIRSL